MKGTEEDKEYKRNIKKIAKKVLRKKNKFGETPLELIKLNLEKIKKIKNPNSEVHFDTILSYIIDKSVKPFDIDQHGKNKLKGFTVQNLVDNNREKQEITDEILAYNFNLLTNFIGLKVARKKVLTSEIHFYK